MWVLLRCVYVCIFCSWSAACNRGISQKRWEIVCDQHVRREMLRSVQSFFNWQRRIGSMLTSTCGSCQAGIPALKHGTESNILDSFANACEGLREVTENGKKRIDTCEWKQGSNDWKLKCSKCCVFCWGQSSHILLKVSQNDFVHEAAVPSCPILPRPVWGLSPLRWCEACQGYSYECQGQDQERCASLHLWVRRK